MRASIFALPRGKPHVTLTDQSRTVFVTAVLARVLVCRREGGRKTIKAPKQSALNQHNLSEMSEEKPKVRRRGCRSGTLAVMAESSSVGSVSYMCSVDGPALHVSVKRRSVCFANEWAPAHTLDCTALLQINKNTLQLLYIGNVCNENLFYALVVVNCAACFPLWTLPSC